MARLRTPDHQMRNADNVPAELYDGDATCWHSAEAFRAWIATHTAGIPDAEMASLDRLETGCWHRRRRALAAWARTVGIVNPRWPDQLDREALDRLGLLSNVYGALERARRRVCPTCRRLGIPLWADRKDD